MSSYRLKFSETVRVGDLQIFSSEENRSAGDVFNECFRYPRKAVSHLTKNTEKRSDSSSPVRPAIVRNNSVSVSGPRTALIFYRIVRWPNCTPGDRIIFVDDQEDNNIDGKHPIVKRVLKTFGRRIRQHSGRTTMDIDLHNILMT